MCVCERERKRINTVYSAYTTTHPAFLCREREREEHCWRGSQQRGFWNTGSEVAQRASNTTAMHGSAAVCLFRYQARRKLVCARVSSESKTSMLCLLAVLFDLIPDVVASCLTGTAGLTHVGTVHKLIK